MKALLSRFCMWLSDLLDRAGWALAGLPPRAPFIGPDTSDRPFALPPDVEMPR